MMRQFLSRFFVSFSQFCTCPVEFGLLGFICLNKFTVCCYGFPKGFHLLHCLVLVCIVFNTEASCMRLLHCLTVIL
jgi:hypothetical protein